MSSVIPLPRISSMENFLSDYYFARQPVVIEGAARQMPAFEKWSDAYLIEVLGDINPLLMLPDGRRARMPFRDYLSYLSNPENFTLNTGPLYMTDLYIRPRFLGPALDVLAPDAVCPLPRPGTFAERTTIFAGPKGTATSMHQDVFSTDAWMAELRGEKSWRICAPQDLDPITAADVDAFSGVDIGCDVFETTVTAGDVIYLPRLWWHQVRNENSTLAIFGHFSTWSEARAALTESLAMHDDLERKSWVALWTAILALEGECPA